MPSTTPPISRLLSGPALTTPDTQTSLTPCPTSLPRQILLLLHGLARRYCLILSSMHPSQPTDLSPNSSLELECTILHVSPLPNVHVTLFYLNDAYIFSSVPTCSVSYKTNTRHLPANISPQKNIKNMENQSSISLPKTHQSCRNICK